jgi:hypothetical protein
LALALKLGVVEMRLLYLHASVLLLTAALVQRGTDVSSGIRDDADDDDDDDDVVAVAVVDGTGDRGGHTGGMDAGEHVLDDDAPRLDDKWDAGDQPADILGRLPSLPPPTRLKVSEAYYAAAQPTTYVRKSDGKHERHFNYTLKQEYMWLDPARPEIGLWGSGSSPFYKPPHRSCQMSIFRQYSLTHLPPLHVVSFTPEITRVDGLGTAWGRRTVPSCTI